MTPKKTDKLESLLTPEQINQKIDKLKSDRSIWDSHWQEIADFIIPRKNSVTSKRPAGEKKVELLDNTAVQANELLAGALHGMLTSPNGQWFELTSGDPELDNDDEVRMWSQSQVRKMHNVLNNSNFHTEKHEMDIDQCGFGTGCMLMEEDTTDVVRFSTRFIGEYFLDEDVKGDVNQIYRIWDWNAVNIVQEFGLGNCPEKVQDAYKKGDQAKLWTLAHSIYPKNMMDPKSGSDFHSQYTLRDERVNLRVGSFDSFPYLTPRFTKAAGEKYGRGPGMVALPEMKVLNKMNETMLIGAQKAVDPPVQLPDDGFLLPIITRPGGINYYRAGSQDMIKPIFNDTRLDFGYQAMEDRRKRIRSAYYVDQLQLQQGGPMMTATEVLQRTEEQMRLLGPMLGRQQSEFLKPMVNRLFAIMVKRKMIDPAPLKLQGKNMGVKYSSFIARTQRVQDGQNVMRWFQAIAPFIQINPSVGDNLDGDAAVRVLAGVYSPPQEIIKNLKDVQQFRADQAKQKQMEQQQAQASQQLAQGAQVTKAAQSMGATE